MPYIKWLAATAREPQKTKTLRKRANFFRRFLAARAPRLRVLPHSQQGEFPIPTPLHAGYLRTHNAVSHERLFFRTTAKSCLSLPSHSRLFERLSFFTLLKLSPFQYWFSFIYKYIISQNCVLVKSFLQLF